jgi:hypothetical protein
MEIPNPAHPAGVPGQKARIPGPNQAATVTSTSFILEWLVDDVRIIQGRVSAQQVSLVARSKTRMPVNWPLACKTPAINTAIECFSNRLHPRPAPRPDGQTGPISQSLYTCVCYTTCAGWRATPTRVLPRICYPPDGCMLWHWHASKEPPAPVEPSLSAGDVSTAALQLL